MHKANRTVLSRYEPAPDGGFYLDAAADTVADLYNSYDKSAPFVRRDLDQDLVAYLIDCGKELRPEKFEIRLTLAEAPGAERFARIQRSIAGYFDYLIEKERQSVRHRLRRSFVLAATGMGILFVSVMVRRWLGTDLSVAATVLSEGLTIAAWVAIWEALVVLAIEWFPFRRRVATFSRLAEARVTVRLRSDGDSDTSDLMQPSE